MTHSFDDQGRHHGGQGNLRDWWGAGSAERLGVKDGNAMFRAPAERVRIW